MKTANEMKKIRLANSKIGAFLEEVVAPKIEAAANAGVETITIITDNISDDVKAFKSRSTIVYEVREYLEQFGYVVDPTADNKKIRIYW